MPKMHWRPGLRPGPRWESSRRSPDPLVGWGGGHPSPIPTPLGSFGASILAPSALSFSASQCKILATPLSTGSTAQTRWADMHDWTESTEGVAIKTSSGRVELEAVVKCTQCYCAQLTALSAHSFLNRLPWPEQCRLRCRVWGRPCLQSN